MYRGIVIFFVLESLISFCHSASVQAFSFFDQDGDGTITSEELWQCMKKLGEDLTLEEVQDMLKEADADGNGEIEFAGKYYTENAIFI